MNKYRCEMCGWVYDPEEDDPSHGVAQGTAFEDVPDDFECPVCDAGIEEFMEV